VEEHGGPPTFTLRQLWYFVAIAEGGSLSAAAERLRVSQSAVSLALTELERSLKVHLCVRRKAHGVTLTPSGRQVLHLARGLLRQADEVTASAGTAGALAGPLSVGCYLTLAPTLLPRLLSGFGELHPDVAIRFEEGPQDTLQRRSLEGELELALLYDMAVLPELERVELFRARPHVVLPADHPLATGTHVALRDLEAEPMVLLDSPPSSTHTLLLCDQAGIRPSVRYRPTNFETTRGLVGRGLGWALLIQRPPNDRTYEDRRIVHLDIVELSDYSVAVLLAWPRHTRPTRRAEAFVKYCVGAHSPGQLG
jgi:DNA-binding transcriptional LysR family regulator